MRTLKVDDVLLIPAGMFQLATNTGADGGAELATNTDEKGNPLVTMVK